MRITILYATLCIVLVGLSFVESRRWKNAKAKDRVSKGRNSKVKKKQPKVGKDECYIKQDEKDKQFYVLCGEAPKPTKRPKSKSKKCKCERGRRGPRGSKGRPGSRGRQGKKGSEGPPGTDGRDGRPGIPGPKGPAGVAGLRGPAGPKGTRGEKGSMGLQGIKGIQGVPGLTGPPGNCIKKSNVGSVASPQFYCLPGKQGVKGGKGDTGPSGPVGPAGPAGNDGKKGERGDTGPRGRIGRPGPPGDFNNISCSTRYTSWINSNLWDSNHPDVYCDTKEFLQGFRIEKINNYRKRYRYICCKLTKT